MNKPDRESNFLVGTNALQQAKVELEHEGWCEAVEAEKKKLLEKKVPWYKRVYRINIVRVK